MNYYCHSGQAEQADCGVTTTYGYGTANDLLTSESVGGVQTQAIGYTADGRMNSFSPGIQAPGGQYITSLSYNQDGRLLAVNASGGALGSYIYDGFGQRVIKVAGSAGNLFQYGQDGMLLEETNASGAGQADYIYLDGRPVAVLNGSTLYYLHTNQLGTPQLATDSNQNAQWQASYDPFGQASVSGTITQNLRLPGQYFDVESGWNHNGFRDYIPDLGRYAEPDPLGRLGGNNLYAYANDDPIDYVDPTGCAAPGADCAAKLEDVRNAIDNLVDRLKEHAAHDGKECNGMDHAKSIRQAANTLAKAMAAAGSCLTEEEKQELEELLKEAWSQFQDSSYDTWQSIWHQLTTMPTQPTNGPWTLPPPIWWTRAFPM